MAEQSSDETGERNLKVALAYLAAISSGAPDEEVLGFFDPAVQQVEYPNRIADTGAARNLTQLKEAAARGREVMHRQTFTVRNAMARGDTVFIEALWEGELGVRAGQLHPGDIMRAHCAMVLELRGGKIVQQRNYDCFEPLRPAS
jgi:ketosteroid isomerase-like protein